jgi:hypothetical protein
MLPRGRGNIFFTGATASIHGGSGFAALCQRQVRLACYCARGCAGARAAEYPRCLVIDSSVDTEWVRQLIAQREGQQAIDNLDPNRLMRPSAVAEACWQLYQQPREAWTFEHEIRPFGEKF